jgi:hypothetical protein
MSKNASHYLDLHHVAYSVPEHHVLSRARFYDIRNNSVHCIENTDVDLKTISSNVLQCFIYGRDNRLCVYTWKYTLKVNDTQFYRISPVMLDFVHI